MNLFVSRQADTEIRDCDAIVLYDIFHSIGDCENNLKIDRTCTHCWCWMQASSGDQAYTQIEQHHVLSSINYQTYIFAGRL